MFFDRRVPWSAWGLWGLWGLALVSSACEREAVDSSPELVVDAFIERMKGVHGDPERGRLAYELIWAAGREALEERARRATAAAGRPIGPEEMLVPSRFSLHFEPERVTAETKGRWSRVTIIGTGPNEVAEVSCVNEDGRWRVAVEFPPLPAIEQRQ